MFFVFVVVCSFVCVQFVCALECESQTSPHHKNFEICVDRVDMMTMNVEAMTNAANGQLQHGGGIAAAFVNAGGEIIQVESDKHIQQFGEIPVSHVAVTGAGSLAAKYIIHVVGPVFQADGNDDELLRNSTLNVLRTARRLCVEQVALPLLSSGIFGFPAERAAQVIMQAVFDFYRESDTAEPPNTNSRLPPIAACDMDGADGVPRKVFVVDRDAEKVELLLQRLHKEATVKSDL